MAGLAVVAWGARSWFALPPVLSNVELLAIAEEAVPPGPTPLADIDPLFDLLFIQPDRKAGWEDPERRRSDLGRAAARGVRTIVVQYLAHGTDSLLGPGPAGVDETAALLDDAAGLGLDVWLGTREDPAIWAEMVAPLDVWATAAAGALDIAEETAERYGAHPAFTGWYWTPEVVWPAPPDRKRLHALTRTTRRAVRTLKRYADKPVAVPLGPTNAGAEAVHGGPWCTYAGGSDADRVVVMDGVGTAHVDVAHLSRLYGVVRGCAEREGFELVADVELFGPGGLPPSPARLQQQVAATLRHAHRRGAFDLGHYLAPGTEGDRFWRGTSLEPVPLKRSGRDPRGVRAELTKPAARIDIATEEPHPDSVELYAILDGGDAQFLGSPTQTHGPGRFQRTWVWRPPPGSEPIRTFEVVLRAEEDPGPWTLDAWGE